MDKLRVSSSWPLKSYQKGENRRFSVTQVGFYRLGNLDMYQPAWLPLRLKDKLKLCYSLIDTSELKYKRLVYNYSSYNFNFCTCGSCVLELNCYFQKKYNEIKEKHHVCSRCTLKSNTTVQFQKQRKKLEKGNINFHPLFGKPKTQHVGVRSFCPR